MHLLVVVQPVEAGVPTHVLALLRGVVADGWKVTVACPVTSVLWRAAADLGVERVATGASRAPSTRDLIDLARLLPLVRRADVVHAHSSKSGMVARLASRMTGRTAHCVFTPHGWSFWALEGRASAAAVSLERAAARWCGRIITVSAYERDAALGLGIGAPDQFRVVANGVDEERFAHGGEPIPGRVVMVARLAPPRLPLLAVEAFAVARRTRPELTLDLVGDGPLRPGIEAAVAALGPAAAGVRLLGSRHDVPDLLRSAACALHLSTYEGASLAVLEAMATGRPVVASRLGGMEELVVDGVTGRLVGDRPEEVAAGLLAVLDRPDGGASLGRAGRSRVEERFTARAMAAATLAVYREVARPD